MISDSVYVNSVQFNVSRLKQSRHDTAILTWNTGTVRELTELTHSEQLIDSSSRATQLLYVTAPSAAAAAAV